MREHRIFGGPGCGKTTRLTQEIARARARFGTRILVCSFTKVAAHELVSRDVDLPSERIGTLHAMAYRALERPTLAEDYLPEWNRQVQPAWRFRRAFDLDEPFRPEPCDASIALLWEQIRNRGLPMPRHLQRFDSQFTRWKFERGLVDFTDLILHATDLDDPGFAVDAIFVDEVQDCAQVELNLIRHWAERAEHCVTCGDDDQCLYHFRGCDPAAFLNPPVPADQKTVLPQSYRLPRVIREYAGAWIAQVKNREPKAFLPARDGGEIVRRGSVGLHNPMDLATAIQAELRAGKTVMLLASCGYMLGPTIGELRRRGVPFHNPYRRKRHDWNPLTSAAPLLHMVEEPWTWAGLWSWVELIDSRYLPTDFKADVRENARLYRDAIIAPEMMAVIMAGFGHSVSPEWLRRVLLPTKRKRLAYGFEVHRRHGPEALKARPRLTLGTAHSVKGGEADVVFLAPDISRASDAEQRRSGSNGRDAIMRTFYVGMTRAREKVVLLGPSGSLSVRWL